METVIATEGLCKNFGEGELQIKALKDVDLSIVRGEFTAIVRPSGSGKTTLLNILCGLDVPSSGEIRVSGIAPILWDEDRKVDIARIANATAKLLECDLELNPSDILSSDEYIGDRYGVLTQEGRDALKLVAETEGIFLDPVYTSKAMAGMNDQIRKGIITKNETVIFIHTGGLPALFAYAEDLMLS